ncbi:hypothetical protein IT157_00760, partial [bacterium]|nr:hypothetical protein [bacterium]
MRSRVHLFLDNLSLDELFFLEQEIGRRKDRFRRHYTVMSVQVERRSALAATRELTTAQTRDFRRFLGESAAAGGGTQLAYSPEVSLILFNTVEGAAQSAASILSGLAEMNGRQATADAHISLKIGIASGEDALAPGSVRCLRSSHVIRRANQCAWKAPSGSLLVDEGTAEQWPQKHLPVRLPLEIEGSPCYRVIPATKGSSGSEDDRFATYLNSVV